MLPPVLIALSCSSSPGGSESHSSGSALLHNCTIIEQV